MGNGVFNWLDLVTPLTHMPVDGDTYHFGGLGISGRPFRVLSITISDQVYRKLELLAKVEAVPVLNEDIDIVIDPKEIEIEVAVKDIKKLELAEITPEFLSDLGFENEQQLRDALKEQMVERIEMDVAAAMREQVYKHLLDNTPIDLPTKLSDRQEQRIVSRRAVDLMMRGMPQDQIAQHVEQLRGGARDEAVRELKLFFILQKIAADRNVDIDEAELNGRIAMLAAQRGRRPEKMKQEMAKDGTLANMYVQMREQKAIDKILESADIEEVEVEEKKEDKKE